MARRPTRIDPGAAAAAAGAITLLVSLFLDWYRPGLTAWTVFEVLDLVLAALALVALATAAGPLGLPTPVRSDRLPLLGGAAVAIVVAALINHPPRALGQPPTTGIWIALAGALLILVGGLLAVAPVSVAISVEPRASPLAADPAPPTPAPIPPHPPEPQAAPPPPRAAPPAAPGPAGAPPPGPEPPPRPRGGPDDETEPLSR